MLTETDDPFFVHDHYRSFRNKSKSFGNLKSFGDTGSFIHNKGNVKIVLICKGAMGFQVPGVDAQNYSVQSLKSICSVPRCRQLSPSAGCVIHRVKNKDYILGRTKLRQCNFAFGAVCTKIRCRSSKQRHSLFTSNPIFKEIHFW
jgi:hypothetical protein